MNPIRTALAPVVLAAAWLAAPALGQQLAAADSPTPDAPAAAPAAASDWASDPVWYDGLVERAEYDAARVIYGKPRPYVATFLTNKEQHDAATLTKDADGEGATLEVWKHNQIEVIPTPNYDYKYEATSHLTTAGLLLTRLDVASQEFCGLSFKQYLLTDGLPVDATPDAPGDGATRNPQADAAGVGLLRLQLHARQRPGGDGRGGRGGRPAGRAVQRAAALPAVVRLRGPGDDGDLAAARPEEQPGDAAASPSPAEVRYAGEGDGTHKLELVQGGEVLGTFEMADDRRHVMVGYDGADGQTYRLKSVERVDYWSTNGK